MQRNEKKRYDWIKICTFAVLIKLVMKALSLFSWIGVSEYYLKDLGIDVVTATDIDNKRCDVHHFFYPNTDVVCGDICDDKVKDKIVETVGNSKIDIVISTPPCQGMSTVGKNKGKALEESKDERNYLILQSFSIIDRLDPTFIVFENVPQLLKVKIPFRANLMSISDILLQKYGKKYEMKINVYNTSDFGIPQNRERVFIRLYKKGLQWKDPEPVEHTVTLRDAIGDLPSLEAGEFSDLKNHWARKHPELQVEWMRHTPTGCSAFSNIEYYPVKSNGERIKGYPNCYKRMVWDAPSPTVTMRNEIMSSQDNVHPGREIGKGLWSDARVLTLRELLILMSLPPDMDLPTIVSDTALRQFIGEGIPSMMMKKIMEGIC